MSVTEVKLVENSVKELLAMGETGKAVDLLIASGHGHHGTIGTLTTGITGGGGTTLILIDQPEGIINVGANTAVIPVRIAVQCEPGLIAADDEVDEILIAVDHAKAVDGLNVTTVVNEPVFNMRGDLGSSLSGEVSMWSAVTAAITAPVLDVELARATVIRELAGAAANALIKPLELLYEPLHPPIIMGNAALGASILVYWGGTVAVVGFAQIQVVAFPKGWVTGLSI